MVAMGFTDETDLTQFVEANGAGFILNFLYGNGFVTAIVEEVMTTNGENNGKDV